MISAYRLLARIVVALVIVQAATHAWMSAGVNHFILTGGVVDKAFMENQSGPPPFPEIFGAIIHGMNGTLVIPLVAAALLVVGLLARFPGAIMWAVVVAVLVALQITLGMGAPALPILGLLHGLNALLLLLAALAASRAGQRVQSPSGAPEPRATVHAAQ
ncbi:MAG TPA: hypothetical protein GXZ30_08275 [Propionibacterium sp.]|nr:hypothetical protein [Propionibacterium sp.]